MEPVLSFLQSRCMDGYRIVDADAPGAAALPLGSGVLFAKDRRFEPLSKRFETYDAFKIQKPFIQFAAIANEEMAAAFVNSHGYPLAVETSPYLTVASVLDHAAGMRKVLTRVRDGDQKQVLSMFNASKLGEAHAELRLVDGTFRLAIVPRSLVQGMWIQLAQDLAGGGIVQACQQCGSLFPAGSGGRRADAKFCSDTCRKAHNYAAKKGARK
jgi:hypothetical protein